MATSFLFKLYIMGSVSDLLVYFFVLMGEVACHVGSRHSIYIMTIAIIPAAYTT